MPASLSAEKNGTAKKRLYNHDGMGDGGKTLCDGRTMATRLIVDDEGSLVLLRASCVRCLRHESRRVSPVPSRGRHRPDAWWPAGPMRVQRGVRFPFRAYIFGVRLVGGGFYPWWVSSLMFYFYFFYTSGNNDGDETWMDSICIFVYL